MALISCPECKKEVSSLAAACIHCGAPLARTAIAVAPAKVVTTQQTLKSYKLIQLVGVMLICAGVVACTAQSPAASAGLWMIGVLLFIGGRAAAWWGNG